MMNRKLKGKIIEKFGTQFDFAKIVRADEWTVSRVINGRKVLDVDERSKWAKALDCNEAELFPPEAYDRTPAKT